MFSLRLGFDHPGYLWLLLGLPLLWWIGYRVARGAGSFRRFSRCSSVRSFGLTIVLALAGVQLVWVSDRVTVMYLLDQSESIPQAKRQVMLDYVIRSVRRHRDRAREDRAGIVVFGRDASIEIPPFDDDIPELRRLESLRGRADATNLESALESGSGFDAGRHVTSDRDCHRRERECRPSTQVGRSRRRMRESASMSFP